MPKPNPNLLAANAAAGYPPPILYLPLNDPTQPGKNLGTGGDFNLTGVVARSGRGPNQFNAPYSDLDGAADYLSRTTAPAGIVDGGIFTLHLCCSLDVIASGRDLISFYQSTTNEKFRIHMSESGGVGALRIYGRDSTGTLLLGFNGAWNLVANRNYVVTVSVDLSDTNKRHVYVNGVTVAGTWSAYTSGSIDFAITTSPLYYIGRGGSLGYIDGKLGNVFFDTRYIDLSQPANLAKFVTGTGIDAKPADLGANGEKPFGTAPLIYLPMYGNNAGKNYGTGGDFTVNSGPYPGARGPNEFWGNKADFNGTNAYLARTSALTGVSDGKTFSCVFWVRPDTVGIIQNVIWFGNASNALVSRILIDASGNLNVAFRNTSLTGVLGITTNAPQINSTKDFCVMLSVDLTDTSKRHLYIDDVIRGTYGTYVNDNMFLSAQNVQIGAANTSSPLDGKLSEFYFTTDYIDFSQEANRLKFRDAFGNPVDLAPQIAAGTLPNPAIYMRFDPASFGKNSGTGGDFVVNGTITDGGQL